MNPWIPCEAGAGREELRSSGIVLPTLTLVCLSILAGPQHFPVIPVLTCHSQGGIGRHDEFMNTDLEYVHVGSRDRRIATMLRPSWATQ